jgi:hypothetical protein
MPEILHESEGLKIVKNDKNQFVICTLFFNADPKKRSAAWRREAEAGMTPAKFAREYLIDYGAQFGERVFPELLAHQDKIILHEPYPVFPTDQVYYGGFDYGMRNPSSFHVYCVWDGITYCVWELYEPCKNIKEFSAKMRDCPYYEQLRWIAADPHIADLRHYGRDGNGASIMDQFRDHGIRKFVLASNDEEAWLGIMRRHWTDNEEDPTFRILDRCPNMIEEFKGAVFAQTKQAIMSANPKEAIADVNNHAMDDCKYYMLTAPKNHQQSPLKFPIMVNKWSK